jgi:hypothetical protein
MKTNSELPGSATPASSAAMAESKQPADTAKVNFDAVLAAEVSCIRKQRQNRGVASNDDGEKLGSVVGLALSGGGIRSASFAIGVLQALHNAKKLSGIDYLSTVSGGGYAGASLTWFNYLYGKDPAQEPFPFGEPGYAVRAGVMQTASTSGGEQLSFVRQHGSYLTPSPHLGIFALIGVVLRNALVSGAVYLSLGVLIALGSLWLGAQARADLDQWDAARSVAEDIPYVWWPTLFFLASFGLLSVFYGVLTFIYPKVAPTASTLYVLRVFAQRVFGVILKLTALAVVAATIPELAGLAGGIHITFSPQYLVGVTGLIGALGAVVQFYRQLRPTPPKRAWVDAVRIAITGSSLVYAVLFTSYWIATQIYADENHQAAWACALAVFVVVAGFLVNLNFFGIGRMYRDRIMETFMADPAAVQSGGWGYAQGADNAFLVNLSGPTDPGPYHLINCNVVLRDTPQSRFRNRGGDSFLLSNAYCGSDATGWIATAQFGNGTMSLATAIAASGAAVNPYAAVAGKGATRTPLVSFMLAFFGVRLGYWVPNPARATASALAQWFLWPNLLLPGLRQGLMGSGFNNNARFLELTDGGHFENTGLYELIRRGCDTVILSLASADPGQSLGDLANAIERVRVDFGVYIFFSDMLKGIALHAGGTMVSDFEKTLPLSDTGYSIGTIEYPNKRRGKLIVLKSSILTKLPIDTIVYAKQNDDFPNESTANQFFTEEQFESYRESGYHITKRMLQNNPTVL